ncbi:Hypothetical predicted protein [Cloeon dipterum]|nr:Hypothetical predicted protein [Cloeon dipterum]
MDDEALVRHTQVRLENLITNCTLEHLAKKATLKIIYSYLNDSKENEISEKLNSLPALLKDEVLQEMLKRKCYNTKGNLKQFELMFKAFKLLLSTRTNEIHLENLLSFCPDKQLEKKVNQLLIIIANKASNLQCLKTTSDDCLGSSTLPEGTFQALLKMKQLKKLFIGNFELLWTQLLELCRSLPALRVLGVSDVSYPRKNQPMAHTINDLKRDLAHLRLIQCSSSSVMTLLRRNLPNLDTLNSVRNFGLSWEDIAVPNDAKGNQTSSLRNFCQFDGLDHIRSEDHKLYVSHPNITHLIWTGFLNEKMMLGSAKKFTRVKFLAMLSIGQKIDGFLVSIGKNLLTLYLNDVKISSLSQVFNACPRLKKLTLKDVRQLQNPGSLSNFSELKELVWAKEFGKVELHDILCAPNLQRVEVTCQGWNQEDLRILTSLIAEKKILSKLHTFRVCFRRDVSSLYEVVGLLKNAAAFLPKLTDLNLSVDLDDMRSRKPFDYLTVMTDEEEFIRFQNEWCARFPDRGPRFLIEMLSDSLSLVTILNVFKINYLKARA